MRGWNKKQCLDWEKLAAKLIGDVLGAGVEDWGGLVWTMPHANGCTVSIRLFRDSQFPGRDTYRASWLACRLEKPAEWLDSGGYVRPQKALPWPSGYTYPSGKNNLHPSRDPATWRRDLAWHLYCLAAEGSREKEAFGAIEWEGVAA